MPARSCPCGGFEKPGARWAECCGPLVEDGVAAASAEKLMRSRYSAFAVHNTDHLWRTWHPRTRPAEVGALDGVTWTGFEILATNDGGPDDDAGTVDFIASCVADGKRTQVREHSRFERRAGRWFYVDGDELP